MKNEENDSTRDIQRQAYSGLKLRVIELATDEVLGVGCKTASDFVGGPALCLTAPCGGSIGS
jgi:hypothetical protein